MIKSLMSFLLILLAGAAGAAEQYEFAASPHRALNRIYRIDRISGEVSACQYGQREGEIGTTICYPPGEGAMAGTAGEFGLAASNHQTEAGIFRVNRRSGEVSVCYVRNDEHVVCTPFAR